MEDLWMQDIMTQKFINSDISRILMIYAMTLDNNVLVKYKRKDILEYIFRMYADNPNICEINPNTKIRNLRRYGLVDVKEILENALIEWDYYAVNHVLKFDDRNIYLDIGTIEDEKAFFNHTKQITKMLQKKYFNLELDPIKTIDADICREDSNLSIFGKSLFRNRVLEDIQYCPLCEEIDIQNLFAVHILPARWCDSDYELIDKNNGIIMCKEHAEEYINGDFYFKETGFVHNVRSDTVMEMMHLSLEIRNKERREYIKEYLKKRTDSGA